jgi:ATP-dependent Lhr-like helicase
MERLIPDAAELDERVMAQLAHSSMFATHFRENAARALLLPRRRAQARTPLWQQRLRSKVLLAAAQRYPQFPIILETYRHCLKDIFDVPALKQLLHGIARREVEVVEVETAQASPFSRSLVFAYASAYLYEQDAPLAERRAQALTLDRDLLRELLGEVELRDLLDPAVLDDVEAQLQHTAEGTHARDADEVHDLLRRLGDLNLAELKARTAADPKALVARLIAQRRAFAAQLAGETRYIAAEEAGRYRDAFGVMPPGGLSDSFVAVHASPLKSIVRRYAKTHGPFVTQSLAERYQMRTAQLVPVLDLLEVEGVVMRGELRPGGNRIEWCDTEVLRRLKRGTLARLRQATAAVDSRALVRFLPLWHKLDVPRRGIDALEHVIAQLEAMALPFSALCQVILPARIQDFHPDMLDMLCASGRIVWVGAGAVGQSDGRVKLWRRAQAAKALVPPEPYAEDAPLHQALLAHLARRGACFMVELSQVVQGTALGDVERALWDLVWSGHVTNDTVQPLRNLQKRVRSRPRAHSSAVAHSFGGRWSLVADLCDCTTSPTERAHVWAHQLLERYGIVSREAAAAEELVGGFAAVYPVFKAMEEAGRARRGYFIEGLSGLQFAFGSAIERLRATDTTAAGLGAASAHKPVYILSVLDPANPYGTLMPWPTAGTHFTEGAPVDAAASKSPQARRLRRTAGAWVVLQDGALLLYAEANGQRIITFAALWQQPDTCAQAVLALAHIAHKRHGRTMHLVQIDALPSLQHPKVAELIQAGAAATFDGLTIAPRPWAQGS